MQSSGNTGRGQASGAPANKGAEVKRSRGRGRRPQSNNANRTFDSTGPEIKIRGSASHVYEKYLQMARDANSQGDRVMAENYLQHAEHYFRIMSAAQAQGGQQPQNGQRPNGNGGEYQQANGSGPAFSLVDDDGEGDEEGESAAAE